MELVEDGVILENGFPLSETLPDADECRQLHLARVGAASQNNGAAAFGHKRQAKFIQNVQSGHGAAGYGDGILQKYFFAGKLNHKRLFLSFIGSLL